VEENTTCYLTTSKKYIKKEQRKQNKEINGSEKKEKKS